MRKYLMALLTLVGVCTIHSQVDIKISIRNILSDTISYGQLLGKRYNEIGKIKRSEDNSFYLKSASLAPGFYVISFGRENNALDTKKSQFLVDQENQKFELNINGFLTNQSSFVNSPANTLLQSFAVSFDSLVYLNKNLKDNWLIRFDEASFNQLTKNELEFTSLNKKMISKTTNPSLIEYFKSINIEYPTWTGSLAEKKIQRQNFIDREYLRGLDFKNRFFVQVPQTLDLMDYYTIYSADADHKKVSERAVNIVNKGLEENLYFGQYYLNYLLNSMSRISNYDYDQVSITLEKTFFDSGKNIGLSKDKMDKIRDLNKNILRLSNGNILPDTEFSTNTGKPQTVYTIGGQYTMLVFWSPDCGHCKKELPVLSKIHSKYPGKGVKVATICSKRGAEGLKQSNDFFTNYSISKDWLNLNDNAGKSSYAVLYDVTSFPKIILIDKNQKIIMKRRGEMSEEEIEKLFKSL
jgi:thiol-disulfide isomerase/thioredoxin